LGDDRLLAVDSVEIVFGGDSECKTFIEAIEYAVMVLRAQQTQPAAYASTYVEVE
jgi:hypothetical protein